MLSTCNERSPAPEVRPHLRVACRRDFDQLLVADFTHACLCFHRCFICSTCRKQPAIIEDVRKHSKMKLLQHTPIRFLVVHPLFLKLVVINLKPDSAEAKQQDCSGWDCGMVSLHCT